MDKSLNLKGKLKNSGGNFSASIASSKLHNYQDGTSTLPRIIESSHEINESGERRTIILNTFSEDGSEGDGTHRWSNQHKMECVEEVIEDVQDFFQVCGLTVLAELNDEIHIRIETTGNIIKVAKSVFTQFNANSPTSGGNVPSHAYNIYVASTTVVKDEKVINSSKSVKKNDTFNINLKINNGKTTIFYISILLNLI